MDVEDDLAAGQWQGRVGAAGELAEGVRPTDIEGVLTAQLRQAGRAVRESGVEIEGVGEVELALEVDGAVEADVVRVDGDVLVVRGFEPPLLGLRGVEPDQRFLDEPVELGDADLVREAGDVPVDVFRTLGRQAERRAGDPASPPRRQLAGRDPRPDPGQPVGQLERVGDQANGRRRWRRAGRRRTRRRSAHSPRACPAR